MAVDEELRSAMIELSDATAALNAQAHTPQGRKVYPPAAEDGPAVWRVDDARQVLGALVRKRQAQLADRYSITGRAEGILMARHNITANNAATTLVTLAQDLNTTVLDVALHLVEQIGSEASTR
jgi:hypothetical protein